MMLEFLEYILIAFISSALLIFMSKIVMQKLLRRPADYYLKEEYRQEELMLNAAGISITDELETNPEGELTGEHIHAQPQIGLEETLKMHLFDENSIPEHFSEPKESRNGSDDGR